MPGYSYNSVDDINNKLNYLKFCETALWNRKKEICIFTHFVIKIKYPSKLCHKGTMISNNTYLPVRSYADSGESIIQIQYDMHERVEH